MADGGDPKSIEQTMGETFDRIASEEKTARETAAAEVAEPIESAPSGEAAEAPASSGSDASPPASAAETDAEKAARLRAEDGKFRKPTRAEKKAATVDPKSAKAAPVAGEAAKPGAAGEVPAPGQTPASPPTKTDQTPIGLAGVNPPAGWSAAAKAKWTTVDPAIQAAVAQREQEVSRGFQAYEGIGRALAPVQQALQMRNVQPAAYVAQMVQIDQALANPATRAQTFDYLHRTYGYQPSTNSAASQPGASNPAMQLHADPQIATLQQQNAAIVQYIQRQDAQRATEQNNFLQETQRQASTDVDAFRADPANEFFDILRDDIRGVFERVAVLNGKMPTLKEAYEQAAWANAQTRPILMARETQKAEDTRTKAAADAAAKARKSAAPNLRGTQGASPSSAGPRRSMEEEMAATYDRIHAA